MAKFKVGDKFEIEIAEVFKGAESGNDKYRIKGFDSLTFDDKGLEKIRQNSKSAEREYKVGDIVYVPEDDRCAVVIWTNGEVGNVLYSDFTLGVSMSVDRFSGIYKKSVALNNLAKEIDEETRNIECEGRDFW